MFFTYFSKKVPNEITLNKYYFMIQYKYKFFWRLRLIMATIEKDVKEEFKKSRRESRVIAMQMIYSFEVSNKNFIEEASRLKDSDAKKFVTLVAEHKEDIDILIQQSLTNYTISRLNVVDLSILRLAGAELLYTDTPSNIVINEALEITKEFSDQGDLKATKFNNRVLDTMLKNVVR